MKFQKILTTIWDKLILRWLIGLLIAAYPLAKLISYFNSQILPNIEILLNQKVKIPQLELSLYYLLSRFIIFIIVVFILILLLNKIVKRFKHDYYFLTLNGLKWKVNKKTGHVEYFPYCKKHQIQLTEHIYRNQIYCLSCAKDHDIEHLSKSAVDITRERVRNIGKAKIAGHLRMFFLY